MSSSFHFDPSYISSGVTFVDKDNFEYSHLDEPKYASSIFASQTLIQNEDGSFPKMPPDYIGAYSPDARKARIGRFIEKRNRRVWTKKVKYDVRKNFADSRLRVKVLVDTIFNFFNMFIRVVLLKKKMKS
jgi:hypothetical protein